MAKELGVKTFFRRLGLIVWKNLYLRKNQWCVTTLEIIFPVVPILIYLLATLGGSGSGKPINQYQHIYYSKEEFGSGEDTSWCNDNATFDPKTDNVLSYTPINAQTTDVIQQLAQVICPSSQLAIVGVLNVTKLEERYNEDWAENEKFRAAIVFTDGLKVLQVKGSTNGIISYAIRTHAEKVPDTRKVLPTQSSLDTDFTQMGPRYNWENPYSGHFGNRYGNRYDSNQEDRPRKSYSGDEKYHQNFIKLQLSLDKILAQSLTKKTFDYQLFYEPLPYPKVTPAKTGRLSVLLTFITYSCYGLGICFMIPSITRNVLSEKQTGISELLRMSGVSGTIQWLGWLIHVSIPQFLTIFLVTVLMCAEISYEAILPYADPVLVFLGFFLYMAATAAMCFFACSLLQKPTITLTVVELLAYHSLQYGSMYILLFANKPFPLAAKLGSAILPNCAFAALLEIFADLQNKALDDSDLPAGANWKHLSSPVPKKGIPSPEDSAVSMQDMILMMLVDTVVYMTLAIYLDCVMPSEHGVKRPWYLFSFNWSWRKKQKKQTVVPPGPVASRTGNPTSTDTMVGSDASGESLPIEQMAVPGFELEPVGAPVGVEVQNMVKRFGRYKTAVNGVSLRMYEGDIFALLGHNGAGKTTLISMLTGFFAPTSGTAVINGFDIRGNLDKARESLGLCPQHNMLFDKLTVFQQLRFFGMLRGLSWSQSKMEAHQLMMQMNFIEKAETYAKKLSGGQKRKLSLGLALIGGTKVVILDEPTSGLDPQGRREIWDILLELRKQRTILLTTHFMEEADVLGDRIGIMANGSLQCCGSSDFLKKYYGTGYTLKVTFPFVEGQDKAPVSEQVPDSQQESTEATNVDPLPVFVKPSPQAEAVLALVQKHVPSAHFKTDRHISSAYMSNEAFIALPGETTTTAVLSQLFADLIPRKERLGIATIGLSEASMDEVFIKVGEMIDVDHKIDEELFLARAPKQYRKGLGRLFGQFLSLLVKKFLYSTRKWALLVFETLIPLGLFVLCVYLCGVASESKRPPPSYSGRSLERSLDAVGRMSSASSSPTSVSGVPLTISFDSYPNPVTFYSEKNDSLSAVSKYLAGLPGAKRVENVHTQVLNLGTKDIVSYKRNCIIGLEVDSTQKTINAMFNLNPYHAAPLVVNVASNLILKALDPSTKYTLRVTVHPFEKSSSGQSPSSRASSRQLSSSSNATSRYLSSSSNGRQYSVGGDPLPQQDSILGLLTSLLISLGLIFLVANFVVNPIEEKVCQAKQLQTMTGVNPLVYWGASFLWDYAIYFVIILLMMIYLPIYEWAMLHENLVLSKGYGVPVLFWITMSYGFSGIFFSYLVSFRASSVSGGFTLVTLVHILGLSGGMNLPEQSVSGFVDFIKGASRMFPTYSLVRTLRFYGIVADRNSQCAPGIYTNFLDECPEPFVVWSRKIVEGVYIPGIGQEVFFITLTGLVYFGLVMLLDFKILWLCGSKVCMDDGSRFVPKIKDGDVAMEKDRVNMLVSTRQIGLECLLVKDLCQAYGTFSAVNRLNFGVHYGECFGLLGINGAGKTTAFRMITGDEMPSMGNAFGFGTSLESNPSRFCSNIGYCPQFDRILPLLTGKQMLELFAGLRGVPFKLRGMEAMTWLNRMGLVESAKVACGKYSGGMKRRLSTAMAMIGDPPLILLDEPTSGVDPVSRRHFWKILEKLREGGQSFILTSHSMDECEALCSRLGIMVNGQFQCFGGVQHLKSKFAQGYSLTLKLNPDIPSDSPEALQDFGQLTERMNEKFQPCEFKDQHQTLVQYHLKNPLMTWDVLFKNMEEVKAEFPTLIDDYSVNETSLEEVFLAFARAQHPERKANASLLKRIGTCSC